MKTMYVIAALFVVGCGGRTAMDSATMVADGGPTDAGQPSLSCVSNKLASTYVAFDEFSIAKNGCANYTNCGGFTDKYTTTNTIYSDGGIIVNEEHTRPDLINFDLVCHYLGSSHSSDDTSSTVADVFCCNE